MLLTSAPPLITFPSLPRLPSAHKRLAVPFRAADTPSERSEYAQPDVALLLTYLSYFYDGLTKEQLRAALEQLVDMGLNAQRDFYNDWLRLSWEAICSGGKKEAGFSVWMLAAGKGLGKIERRLSCMCMSNVKSRESCGALSGCCSGDPLYLSHF